MQHYPKSRSAVRPEALKIDECSVWICKDLKPITETTGEHTFEGWEYDMVRYGKDEYIRLMDEQLTDTQLALCELYEGMV